MDTRYSKFKNSKQQKHIILLNSYTFVPLPLPEYLQRQKKTLKTTSHNNQRSLWAIFLQKKICSNGAKPNVGFKRQYPRQHTPQSARFCSPLPLHHLSSVCSGMNHFRRRQDGSNFLGNINRMDLRVWMLLTLGIGVLLLTCSFDRTLFVRFFTIWWNHLARW